MANFMDKNEQLSVELIEKLIRDWKCGSILQEKTCIVSDLLFLTTINQSPRHNDEKILHQQ